MDPFQVNIHSYCNILVSWSIHIAINLSGGLRPIGPRWAWGVAGKPFRTSTIRFGAEVSTVVIVVML